MEQPLAFEGSFSTELLQAVGILFITCAAAETVIGLQLIRVLSHPGIANTGILPAISGMDVSVRLAVIRVRVAQIAPSCAPEISRITAKIQNAFGHRNNIAHNFGHDGRSKNHIDLRSLRFNGDGSIQPNRTYDAKQIRTFSFLLQERLKGLDSALGAAGVLKLAELA